MNKEATKHYAANSAPHVSCPFRTPYTLRQLYGPLSGYARSVGLVQLFVRITLVTFVMP